MKSIKFLLVAILAMIVCSVQAQSATQINLKSTSGKLVNFGKIITATTADATPVIVDTSAIKDNSAGLVQITVSGSSAAGDGVTGKLVYRYKKVAGTLTVATADVLSAIVADTNVSGATFAAAATSYGNLKLTLTGKAAVTIKWKSVINPFPNQ